MAKIRVMTFNIHGWLTRAGRGNVEQVAQVIREANPDIAGLNEVFHPLYCSGQGGGHGDRQKGESALIQLADQLGMNYVFGPCDRWQVTEHLPVQSYGNALLTCWPILASASHRLTPIEGKEQRGLLEARIRLPNDALLTVYVTHLDHTDEEARLIQLRALRTWTVRDRNRAHVVLGDFNAVHPWDYRDTLQTPLRLANNPRSGHMSPPRGPLVIPQLEKAGYVDTLTLCGEPGQASFIPSEEPLRIDYIWVNKVLADRVLSAQIWHEQNENEASDHRPVLAEIDV